jgi:hypothetical protein
VNGLPEPLKQGVSDSFIIIALLRKFTGQETIPNESYSQVLYSKMLEWKQKIEIEEYEK